MPSEPHYLRQVGALYYYRPWGIYIVAVQLEEDIFMTLIGYLPGGMFVIWALRWSRGADASIEVS